MGIDGRIILKLILKKCDVKVDWIQVAQIRIIVADVDCR
jgi:hypothetical protein